MKQIINSIRYGPPSASGARYWALSGNEGVSHITPGESEIVMPCAGTFRNFVGYIGSNHSNVTSTLYVNRVATALTLTVPAGTEDLASDLVNEVSVNAGDRVVLFKNETASILDDYYFAYSIEFEGDMNIYGLSNFLGGFSIGQLVFGGGLGNGGFVSGSIPGTNSTTPSISSVAGIIDRLAIFATDGAIGEGGVWTAYIYKDGILQDGSGGTVDSACPLDDADEENLVTFSPITVTPPEVVEIVVRRTVANRSGAFYNVCVSLGFTPNISGEFMLTGGGPVNVSAVANGYHWNQEPLELDVLKQRQVPVGPTGFTARGLYVTKDAAPGVGGLYNNIIVQDGVSTEINAVVADLATTALYTGASIPFVDGQFISLLSNPVSAVGGSRLYWGLAAFLGSVPPVVPSTGSGMYFIDPGKRNDTLYAQLTPTVLTKNVKIP